MWGRFVEHELGFRSEFAYPKEITHGFCVACHSFVEEGGLARAYVAAPLFGLKALDVAFLCKEHMIHTPYDRYSLPASYVFDELRRAYGLEECITLEEVLGDSDREAD